MKEDDGAVFDALVHGFYIAVGAGVIVGAVAWSFAVAIQTFLAVFVLLGIAPAIYQIGRRDRGRGK